MNLWTIIAGKLLESLSRRLVVDASHVVLFTLIKVQFGILCISTEDSFPYPTWHLRYASPRIQDYLCRVNFTPNISAERAINLLNADSATIADFQNPNDNLKSLKHNKFNLFLKTYGLKLFCINVPSNHSIETLAWAPRVVTSLRRILISYTNTLCTVCFLRPERWIHEWMKQSAFISTRKSAASLNFLNVTWSLLFRWFHRAYLPLNKLFRALTSRKNKPRALRETWIVQFEIAGEGTRRSPESSHTEKTSQFQACKSIDFLISTICGCHVF